MNYIDGIVAAVPTANREKYIEHCIQSAAIFKEYGALKMVECRGDDVPDGEITSFPMAVQCRADETVCFSWILWPSRDERNTAMAKLMQDGRMDPEKNPMPFDGMHLIYGGFEVVVEA